jgi:hypothetical protein
VSHWHQVVTQKVGKGVGHQAVSLALFDDWVQPEMRNEAGHSRDTQYDHNAREFHGNGY